MKNELDPDPLDPYTYPTISSPQLPHFCECPNFIKSLMRVSSVTTSAHNELLTWCFLGLIFTRNRTVPEPETDFPDPRASLDSPPRVPVVRNGKVNQVFP